MKHSGEGLSLFFKTMKMRLDRCLEPTMKCTSSSIRAHSIQNSGAMDLLEENGHLIMFRPLFRPPNPPDIQFKLVGRHEASTFTGLCNQHDTELFKPIDVQPLDLRNNEQLFLLAYRSVTRELHTCMESACRIQTALHKLVERGIVNANESSPPMLEATGQLIKAYETYRYRASHYDHNLLKRDFKQIKHRAFLVECQPKIAVSSMFGLPEARRKNELLRLVLNVTPIDHYSTAVILSYPRNDELKAAAVLKPILDAREKRNLRLSTLIVSFVENIVISPRHYDSWTVDKRNAILRGFASTMSNSTWLPDDEHYLLF